MFKSDVINFYGTKAKVAKAAGVDPSAVSQWQELVPEGRAMRLFERWKAIDTRDKREKFTALVPAIMEAIRINDFRLYREISDGKSITYMIAGLNKEYGDVVESGLLFADPAVVDRETDELIEKAIAFKLAYRQQYQQKAGWNYEPSFC